MCTASQMKSTSMHQKKNEVYFVHVTFIIVWLGRTMTIHLYSGVLVEIVSNYQLFQIVVEARTCD
jgi:hypothetical protein